MTETKLSLDYDALHAGYIHALLAWEELCLSGEHEAAAVLRVRVIKLRGRKDEARNQLAASGVEV